MKTFVISLERAAHRREEFRRRHSWLQFEYLAATDGRVLAQRFQRIVSRANFVGDFSFGALGCLLSHRSAWRQQVERGWEYMVVLEDDVIVKEESFRFWTREIQSRFEWDVFFLGANNQLCQPLFSSRSFFNFKHGVAAEAIQGTLFCSYGYVVRRDTAARLLRETKMGVPVDYWAKYRGCDGRTLKYLVCFPNAVVPSNEAAQSSIQSKKRIETTLAVIYALKVLKNNLLSRTRPT